MSTVTCAPRPARWTSCFAAPEARLGPGLASRMGSRRGRIRNVLGERDFPPPDAGSAPVRRIEPPGHPQFWSEFTATCRRKKRRSSVHLRTLPEEGPRLDCLAGRPVFHLSVHSFTPVMEHRARRRSDPLRSVPACRAVGVGRDRRPSLAPALACPAQLSLSGHDNDTTELQGPPFGARFLCGH